MKTPYAVILALNSILIPSAAVSSGVSALPSAARAKISAVVAHDNLAYSIKLENDQLMAKNPRHGLKSTFKPGGVTVESQGLPMATGAERLTVVAAN